MSGNPFVDTADAVPVQSKLTIAVISVRLHKYRAKSALKTTWKKFSIKITINISRTLHIAI